MIPSHAPPLSYDPLTDFADPPSNFSCVAVDREDNYLLPSLLASWEAPLLISGGLKDDHKYFVRVQNDCYNVGSSTCAVIELRQDDDVICSVFLDLDPLNDNIAGGVATVNGINTAEQRRTCKSVHSVFMDILPSPP